MTFKIELYENICKVVQASAMLRQCFVRMSKVYFSRQDNLQTYFRPCLDCLVCILSPAAAVAAAAPQVTDLNLAQLTLCVYWGHCFSPLTQFYNREKIKNYRTDF